MKVVIALRPYIIERPKLSDMLLSMPGAELLKPAIDERATKQTFEVLSEAIEETAAGDSVVEADVSEKYRLKESCMRGEYSLRIQ